MNKAVRSVQKQLIIVSGLAGSGKTTVFKALEDLGYYCIDNLPLVLLKSLAIPSVLSKIPAEHIVLELDSRDSEMPEEFQQIFEHLSDICSLYFLYTEASSEILFRRFRETRRQHPLVVQGLTKNINKALELDKKTMEPVRALASKILDTSLLSQQDLRKYVLKNFEIKPEDSSLLIHFLSFGFKHGTPSDLDTMFDVRCFKNPYYEPLLKNLTGLDDAVQKFVLSDPEVISFLQKTKDYLDYMIPLYVEEGRRFLIIGVGCTGGVHRSVVVVNELFKHYKSKYSHISFEHRNIQS